LTQYPLIIALAVLSIATPSVGRAEIVDIVWDNAGRFERRLTVAPGKFTEVCGRLEPSSLVQWRFAASAPLNFNVHYHEGRDVKFPAKQDAVAESSGRLSVAVQQDSCWMWTNKSAGAVSLEVDLFR
jgi:hypothetical protein